MFIHAINVSSNITSNNLEFHRVILQTIADFESNLSPTFERILRNPAG